MKISNGVKKNQIIILVAVVLVFGGIIGWALFQTAKIPSEKEVVPPEGVGYPPERVEEVYSLTGTVSEVNVENNFLMVTPTGEEEEVKVIVSEDTKIFKVVPAGEGNPIFVTKRKEITLAEIKIGDQVFIKSKINITGLKVLDNIDYIEVLF